MITGYRTVALQLSGTKAQIAVPGLSHITRDGTRDGTVYRWVSRCPSVSPRYERSKAGTAGQAPYSPTILSRSFEREHWEAAIKHRKDRKAHREEAVKDGQELGRTGKEAPYNSGKEWGYGERFPLAGRWTAPVAHRGAPLLAPCRLPLSEAPILPRLLLPVRTGCHHVHPVIYPEREPLCCPSCLTSAV